jgi:RNA polymerase sigma factor (sigma-70 family)
LKELQFPYDVPTDERMHAQGRIALATRRSLVSRLRNPGDNESWRQFFELYWKLIYSFAIKCGCTDAEAEEVVQETVISVSKKMPDYKYDPVICSFKGWLLHVTNWRVIDQLRKRDHLLVREVSGSKETSADSCLANIPDPLSSELETLWKEEWEKNLMDAAMQRVKRKANAQQYQVFHLQMVKKYSTEKISKLLSISRAQVYLARHRIAGMVKKEVKLLERNML